jgi:alpha-1,2-mannosyltransferase
MHFNLILIFLMLLNLALLAFIYTKQMPDILMKATHRFLAISVLWGLFANFFVAYVVGDPTVAMADQARPYTEPYSWDMGATSIGWIIFEIRTHYSGADSWWVMSNAIDLIRVNPESEIYKELFFNQHIKFQYPTSSLLPLDFFQQYLNIPWWRAYWILNLISALSLTCTSWIFYRFYYRFHLAGLSLERFQLKDKILGYGLSFVCIAIFNPIIFSLYVGQVQTLLILLVSLALLAFQHKKYKLSGALFGFCVAFKPQWVLIFIWAALRKQWSMLCSGLILVFMIFILAIYKYGFNNFIDYIEVLSYLGKVGESYYFNQSVNGLVNRALMNGINTVYNQSNSIPPYNSIVHIATFATSAIMIVFAMLWRVKKQPNIIDLAIITLTLTMASPVAWNHHYAVLIPIFAILFSSVIRFKHFGRWSIPSIFIIWMLTSQSYEGITNQLSATHWNFLQSLLFFGGLITLVILYKISKSTYR